jgi:hypothetical protein
MSKLSHLVDDEWVEHRHPPVFREPAEDDPYRRVVATVPGSDPDVFLLLASCLTAPLSSRAFCILCQKIRKMASSACRSNAESGPRCIGCRTRLV